MDHGSVQHADGDQRNDEAKCEERAIEDAGVMQVTVDDTHVGAGRSLLTVLVELVHLTRDVIHHDYSGVVRYLKEGVPRGTYQRVFPFRRFPLPRGRGRVTVRIRVRLKIRGWG